MSENEAVKRKVRARTPPVSTASSSTAITPRPVSTSNPTDYNTKSTVRLSILPNLVPTIDERAVNFFFSNHVAGLNASSRGFIDQVQDLPDHDLGVNLMTSIKAVGLAGFSNAARAPELMREAKKNYTVAVRLLNSALHSPVEVKKDTTLLAIMILGIFETLTGREEDSLIAWAAHLKGAAALMEVRGPQQLSTMAGRRLYGQITASLITVCLQQEIAVPGHILDLNREVFKYVNENDIIWANQRVILLFTNFYAKLKHGEIVDFHEILDKSTELEDMLIQPFADAPHDWTFTTVYTEDHPDLIYHGCYHIYHHALAAVSWNGMRAIRVMLNEIIRDTLLLGLSAKPPVFVEPKHTEQLQSSTDILHRTMFDIIASVPQYLGYAGEDSARTTFNGSSYGSEFSQSLPEVYPKGHKLHPYAVKASVPLLRTALYNLPWTLYTVGTSSVVTDPTLRWVIRTLKLISSSLGIRQATILATKLEQIRLPQIVHD